MNILFTGFHFDGWHGSMMHICEIAEYLSQKGHQCYCASVCITNEVRDYTFSKGLKVFPVFSVPLDIEYDIVWAYHFPIFGALMSKGLKYKKTHFGSLSSFVELEILPPYCEEGSLITVVSHETKKAMVEKHHFNSNSIEILPNLLPDSFSKGHYSPHITPQKIIVVSNHPTEEILNLPSLLPDIQIDFFGSGKENYTPMSAEILSKYDVVITIGKTIQYALGMGIPVYEYDTFGGCGYIGLDNLLEEEKYNFSGRKTHRKISADKIASEIINLFNETQKQSPELRKIALERYLLSKNIDILLDKIQNSPKGQISHSPENQRFFNYCKSFIDYCSTYAPVFLEHDQKDQQLAFLNQTLMELNVLLLKKEAKISELKRENQNLASQLNSLKKI